ncbi:MAG TPA: MFS transporter [Woeseiaceae bacterium]|nr:MFS transporter [Woeseiaceae bacterium]
MTAATPGWRTLVLKKPVVSWALYDFGNSAFATSVLVGFFPLFFNDYWSVDASGAETTARLMTTNGIASLLLALSAPLLGAIADRGGWRKRLLTVFAVLGAAATAWLFFVPQGAWMQAAIVFAVASIGFAAANIFYDSMLVDVTSEQRFDRVSAFGFSAGYIGGGLLFAVHLVMILQPGWFGLPDLATAVRVAFLTVAVWWLLFTTPLLAFVHVHRPPERLSVGAAMSQGFSQLAGTFRQVRKLRPAMYFLIAYWLYIDGVNTVMKVAIDFGYKIGVGPQELMIALLVVQFVSFPAALAFGALGERIGPKKGILIGLAIYVAVTSWAAFMTSVVEFFTMACLIGVAQGGVQSLSRSLFARLIPPDKPAEFFGFYNMIGKFAAVLGPFFVAFAAAQTGNARSAVAAILPLLIAGAAILVLAPDPD